MSRTLVERALKRETFKDLHIVDSHCHMGPWFSYHFAKAEIDQMIEDADLFGIEKLCIFPHAGISNDCRLANDQMHAAIDRYPDRVWGVLTINGHKAKEIGEEFDRYYSDPAVIGVKVHPTLHKYPMNGPNFYVVYEKVKRQGGYVFAHTWEDCLYANMEFAEDVLRDFPEVPFILAHAGGTRLGVAKTVRLVNEYENAFLDTSGFEFSDTWIEDLTNRADPSKIIFGTDVPFHDIRQVTARILFADIPDETKERILGGNFRAMLKMNPKKNV